jgi:hypothetical protein
MHEIGYDFDSTLVQSDLTLCDIISERIGRLICPEDILMYDIQHCAPELSNNDVQEVIDMLGTTEHTFRIPPLPGAFDFLKWYGKHHAIHIITNRYYIEPVYIYLQHNLNKQTFDKVKIYHSKDKGNLCRQLGLRYFIDDHIKNIVNIANAGIIPVLFKQNWNKNVISTRSNLFELIRFVDNWDDVYSLVTCEHMNMI